MLNMSSLTAKVKLCLHSPIAIIQRNYNLDHCIFGYFFNFGLKQNFVELVIKLDEVCKF